MIQQATQPHKRAQLITQQALSMDFLRGRALSPKDDAQANTLRFCMVSSDNACKRWDLEVGSYDEELSLDGANCAQLKTFFKDHEPSVDNAIGKVERVVHENGELIADVRFSTDADAQKILQKYKEGVLSDVSIGYAIKEYKDSRAGGRIKRLVTSYDVFELSAVWKGADKYATQRAAAEDLKKDAFIKSELENIKKDKESL